MNWAPDGDGKLPHELVKYSKGMLTGPDKAYCAICVNYITGGSCQKVQSPIDPTCWCLLFEKRSSFLS